MLGKPEVYHDQREKRDDWLRVFVEFKTNKYIYTCTFQSFSNKLAFYFQLKVA